MEKSITHFFNNSFVTEDQLVVSPRDLGFTRGFAVFDYLRTYNLKPFKLKQHAKRLLFSANLIGIRHKFKIKDIEGLITILLGKNPDISEKTIKIMLSGGISDGLIQKNEPTLIVTIDPLVEKNSNIYKAGVRIKPIEFVRYKPLAKTNNYIELLTQNNSGQMRGYFELLYYSKETVHECSTSNVFCVKDNIIYTPVTGLLKGITRSVIINDLEIDLKIVERDFDLQFLLNSDEVFITSSGKEIVPVVKIGKSKIGNGKVGKVTLLVMNKFRNYINSGKW